MTLSEMKTHYFNEAAELGLASEAEIERLCIWLESEGYDSDFAHYLWYTAKEEIEYMIAELG